jgi:hypothetical protein
VKAVTTFYIYQTDISYDSVDFDDPISTLSYFKKLFRSYAISRFPSLLPEEEVEKLFEDIMHIIKTKTEEGSTRPAEVQAHYIMRSAAEKIHGAFREMYQDSDSVATYKRTSNFVTLVMIEAMADIFVICYRESSDIKQVWNTVSTYGRAH